MKRNEIKMKIPASHSRQEGGRVSENDGKTKRLRLKHKKREKNSRLTVLFPLFLTTHFSSTDSFSSTVIFEFWLLSKNGVSFCCTWKLSAMKNGKKTHEVIVRDENKKKTFKGEKKKFYQRESKKWWIKIYLNKSAYEIEHRRRTREWEGIERGDKNLSKEKEAEKRSIKDNVEQ